MAEDLINNKDIYFPTYLGTNDKLITLLNRASKTLCEWFSKSDENGPLPFDDSFKCIIQKIFNLRIQIFFRFTIFRRHNALETLIRR